MNEKRDCNQCGDYEYCAFDYANCTGFIPGDNYVYERVYEKGSSEMTEITPLEYIRYEEEFFKKHDEYLERKVAINRDEKAGKISEEEANKLRNQLVSELGEYSSIYNADKYCVISDALETMYMALGRGIDENFKTLLSEQKKYRGKKVKMCGGLEGELLNVAVSLDDYYYIIKDATGKVIFDTGVDGIEKEL